VADVRAIIYIRGKWISEKTIELARQKEIPVLTTPLGMLDVCGILREHGMKGAM
jgi:hypothetical protein